MVTLLLISGSIRSGSTNTATLRTAALLLPAGTAATLFDALGTLPAFNPDDDVEPLHPAVAKLRNQLAAADAVLFCTPEYAGGMPGALKNLLDWTVGGVELTDKPVAWINVASEAAPTGAAGAHAGLRSALGYVGARVIEPACLRIPVARADVGADGMISDPAIRGALSVAMTALAHGHPDAAASPGTSAHDADGLSPR